MVYGIWYMVYGIWYTVYGIWYMVHGTWYMVYGILFWVMGVPGVAGGLRRVCHVRPDHQREGRACHVVAFVEPVRWDHLHGRDSGFGIRDSGFGFRDSGFGIRDSGFGCSAPRPARLWCACAPCRSTVESRKRGGRCGRPRCLRAPMIPALLRSAPAWDSSFGVRAYIFL